MLWSMILSIIWWFSLADESGIHDGNGTASTYANVTFAVLKRCHDLEENKLIETVRFTMTVEEIDYNLMIWLGLANIELWYAP